MKKEMGEKIRAARERAGHIQEQLAEGVEVSIDTVRRWESGVREPRASDIARLAKFLKVEERYFFGSREPWEVRLILNREGGCELSRIDLTGVNDSFVGVSNKGIVLHLSGDFRTEEDLNTALAEFKKIGLEAIEQRGRWLEDGADNTCRNSAVEG